MKKIFFIIIAVIVIILFSICMAPLLTKAISRKRT